MSRTPTYKELPKNQDLKESRKELNHVLNNKKTKALALKIFAYLEGGEEAEKEKKEILSFLKKAGKSKTKENNKEKQKINKKG